MVRPHRQMRDDRNCKAKCAAEKGSETERDKNASAPGQLWERNMASTLKCCSTLDEAIWAQGVSCSRGVQQVFFIFLWLCVSLVVTWDASMATQRRSLSPGLVEGVAREASSSREVATTIRCTEAGSATSPATAQDSRPSPGCEGVRGPRSDYQVGSRNRSRWGRRRDEALRKASQQAQIPPIEVRVKSCEQFLDRARKNVSKAQEEVSKARF